MYAFKDQKGKKNLVTKPSTKDADIETFQFKGARSTTRK